MENKLVNKKLTKITQILFQMSGKSSKMLSIRETWHRYQYVEDLRYGDQLSCQSKIVQYNFFQIHIRNCDKSWTNITKLCQQKGEFPATVGHFPPYTVDNFCTVEIVKKFHPVVKSVQLRLKTRLFKTINWQYLLFSARGFLRRI